MTNSNTASPKKSARERGQADLSSIPVSRSGVCVVDGYGIRLRVHRGRLVISDGIGPLRRESQFARATVGIRRLVLLGHSGFMTLDALRWLADVGIGFIHLDPDGRILATSSSFGLDDPRLRRAQALARNTSTGIGIARDLLQRKLASQARVAAELPNGGGVPASIQNLRGQLEVTESPAALMIVEAAAAAAYWEAWSAVPIPWVRVDAAKVPEHWRTVGPRSSPLTGNPRLAATPAQALLNYGYAVLEGEARLACLAAGLDPGLGVLHADQRSRDSLALDLMEAVRPEVDAYVLRLLSSSVFRADDFRESRQGVVRILPPLSHGLAETAPQWGKVLAPVVERVAKAFADGRGSRVGRLPTKLTQANRSAGRDHLRRQPRTVNARHRGLERSICRGCGTDVVADQAWCKDCRPNIKLQAGLDGLESARAVRAELRKQGHDPAASVNAKAKRNAALRRRHREKATWDSDHPQVIDPAEFHRNVLPLIQEIPVRRLAALTGLSVSYCALIRRGLHTPHPRWWDVLAEMAQVRPNRP
jgi:CRISPR-associated endonuclease Cas1